MEVSSGAPAGRVRSSEWDGGVRSQKNVLIGPCRLQCKSDLDEVSVVSVKDQGPQSGKQSRKCSGRRRCFAHVIRFKQGVFALLAVRGVGSSHIQCL